MNFRKFKLSIPLNIKNICWSDWIRIDINISKLRVISLSIDQLKINYLIEKYCSFDSLIPLIRWEDCYVHYKKVNFMTETKQNLFSSSLIKKLNNCILPMKKNTNHYWIIELNKGRFFCYTNWNNSKEWNLSKLSYSSHNNKKFKAWLKFCNIKCIIFSIFSTIIYCAFAVFAMVANPPFHIFLLWRSFEILLNDKAFA